jgi:protoheme IX farnesyltransferase
MWYDRDIDAVMRRTRNRPLPAGSIKPDNALAFGIALAAGSIIIMGLAINLVAAAILALSVFFYVFIYTIWLKRSTPQNIVIGGAAGAFPPVIGWAAVTGSVDLMPLIMFGMIFIWTPPHFWALALWANDDYARAGVPMLPVIAGAKETRRQIVIYTVILVPLTLLPSLIGFSGIFYTLSAAGLGAMFLWHAYQVIADKQDQYGVSLSNDMPAKKCFRYSISYLFLLFGALAVDRLFA